MKNGIAFLVGSGISRYAKMPTIEDITKAVLSGDEVITRPGVTGFLNKLRVEADQYYSKKPGRTTNYEDLYFLASQVFHSEWRMIENPAVQAMIDKMDVKPLLSPELHRRTIPLELEELAAHTMEYIVGHVVRMLSKGSKSTSYLGAIMDGCKDPDLAQVDIFTLNHDGILESALQRNRVAYCDGFDPQVDTIGDGKVLRRFDRELFQTTQCKVRIFKLHGSIDWYRYRTRGSEWEFTANPWGGGPLEFVNRNGGPLLHTKTDDRMILLGTINKMLSYSDGIYADLHWELDGVLRKTQRLVVSGYGFGDTGINWRLIDWVFSSPDRRMIVVDPKPDRFQTAATSIEGMWSTWIGQGKLRLLSKGIENTTWPEILECLL
jgi:hypothetical protein